MKCTLKRDLGPPRGKMQLSIIIVNWNTKDLLKDCLGSIYQNPLQGEFEVFVVDNASFDRSPEMVEKEFSQVKLIRNKKNLGFAKANNQGIKSSYGDYILLLNSDTLIPPHSLGKMIDCMNNHPRVGILGPELVDEKGEIIQMSWGWSLSICREILQKFFTPRRVQKNQISHALTLRLQQKERKVPIVAGASMLIRRKMLDEIGLLDENLVLYLEEPDICLRAWNAGWQVVFNPKIKIIHLLGRSTPDPWGKTALIYRQSHLYFYKKNRSKIQLLLLKIYLYLKFYIIYLTNRGRNAASRERADFCRKVFSLLKEEITFKLE